MDCIVLSFVQVPLVMTGLKIYGLLYMCVSVSPQFPTNSMIEKNKRSDSRWHRVFTRDLLISSVFIHHLIGKGVKSDSENTLELCPVLISILTEVHSKQRLHHSSFY